MNNRFVRGIRAGEIDTIEELKTAFKRLAKLTHPDLGGSSGAAEDFIRVRAEYEKAIEGFDRYRFGACAGAEPARSEFDRAAFYACLLALFKRGFPKVPRHEKERLRYEYARYLALGQARAWAPGRGALLEGFEAAMLDAKSRGGQGFGAILDLLLGIFEFHAKGIPLIRRGIELQYSILAREGPLDPAIGDFIELLIGDMGEGPALLR